MCGVRIRISAPRVDLMFRVGALSGVFLEASLL